MTKVTKDKVYENHHPILMLKIKYTKPQSKDHDRADIPHNSQQDATYSGHIISTIGALVGIPAVSDV